MRCRNKFSARANVGLAAVAFICVLGWGSAFAQTASEDQLDTGQLIDAMLGVQATSEESAPEPAAATADTGPISGAPTISPAGPSDIIETNTLLLTGTGDVGDSTITWSTSDGTIAAVSPTVSPTTTVTAGNVGTATVTATGDITGPTNTTINVIAATVGVSPATGTIPVLGTISLSAASDATGDTSFAWSTSDAAVATVDAVTGLVTAVAVGTATITATANTTGRTGTAAITVSAVADPEQGPCFIATAAYGTPLAQDISALREVRDTYLLTNLAGTVFADMYYRLSPPIADAVAQHPALATAVRVVLAPLTLAAALLLAHPALAALFVVSMPVFVLRRGRRSVA